ncbi:ABC transporter substrate-binding protein [Paenibacillus oceani]|uniref:Carbohydrate ABC transporter substrate-binding protein n=1 Tax=Paenibacillus oceani TaxID=2772510 RepID=A0A927GZP5_9BACL|nr:ABC transporter substrate-binding protein [Paenibacillus oceani]MBD2862865.1 carbohydrate ABC transporter substrate-binding protein [Paenibacillus oceani]
MKTKIAFLATVGGMLLAAACGPKAIEESNGESQPETGLTVGHLAKQAAEPQVELVFTASARVSIEQFMEQHGGKEIQKKFPNTKITFLPGGDLQTLVTTKQHFDILLSSVGLTPSSLLTYDLQSDISDLIAKTKYDLSRLEPSTIEIQRQLANGGIYGLPVNTVSSALFYNKDLFDRFGVGYPTDRMTWNELFELTKRMTRSEGGVRYSGLTIAFQHLMFLNQLSAPHLDPVTNKARFTDADFTRAFENMARFYRIPGNGLTKNTFSLPEQKSLFNKEQTAAMHLTLSSLGVDNIGMNWDMVRTPVFPDKPDTGPQSYPSYFYLTSMSKQRDAAFQVLAYITSDEFQEWQAKNGVPTILNDQTRVMTDFGINQPLYKGKNIKAILPEKFAGPTLKPRYQSMADKEVLNALGEYSAGKDVNSALREAAERADRTIAAEAGK